ncbi:MAG: hypothetical protein QGH83_02050 [Candidatus Pacebacteria bacterium]|jgi:predicted RNase H-like nuclease (RuvC/YqgF family)|nr:hypothetical protein [Candidatus Paceibacterota bacterium]|tara:strand:- start:4070 stop:4300 length:231 start_codon:yes stop_codon:yes gene_type:complete
MVREGYWDFMGRKLREEGPKTTKIDMEGLLKRDITEMQKTVHFLQTRVRDLTDNVIQLKQKIVDLGGDPDQLEMRF